MNALSLKHSLRRAAVAAVFLVPFVAHDVRGGMVELLEQAQRQELWLDEPGSAHRWPL